MGIISLLVSTIPEQNILWKYGIVAAKSNLCARTSSPPTIKVTSVNWSWSRKSLHNAAKINSSYLPTKCSKQKGLIYCSMGRKMSNFFLSKIKLSAKNRPFCQKSNLLSKIELFKNYFFVKNRTFCQKSNLLSKIEL